MGVKWIGISVMIGIGIGERLPSAASTGSAISRPDSGHRKVRA